MIILEGVDGGGKSTLIEYFRLMGLKNLTVKGSGGPCKSIDDYCSRMEEVFSYLERRDHAHVLYDRISCFSEAVYGPTLRGVDVSDTLSEIHRARLANDPRVIIIHCAPPCSVAYDHHQPTEGQSREFFDSCQDNHTELYIRYQLLMRELPHIPYDWTQDALGHAKRIIAHMIQLDQRT